MDLSMPERFIKKRGKRRTGYIFLKLERDSSICKTLGHFRSNCGDGEFEVRQTAT
jgi:hypothetical protein